MKKNIILKLSLVIVTLIIVCSSTIGFLVIKIYPVVINFMKDLTTSPTQDSTAKDFYTKRAGWDYSRLPLIKPYQAISIDKSTWSFAMHEFESTGKIEKLSVSDKKIIYSDEKGKWFVFDTDNKKLLEFNSEEDVITNLKSHNITYTDSKQIEDWFDEFISKGYLSWFPEEYKK